MVRTSVTVRNVIGRVNTDYCLTGTVNAGGKTINYTHKAGSAHRSPVQRGAPPEQRDAPAHADQTAAVCLQRRGRAPRGRAPVLGGQPAWLKPKDRISIGSRVFMVLPDISDSDEIGLAVEVEA